MKKYPNKRILFQVDRIFPLSPLVGMENLLKNTFMLDEKLLTLVEISEKKKRKSLLIAVIRALNRLAHNLNNGFH